MHAILQFLRRNLPAPVVDAYHRLLSLVAAVWYGNPSKRLVVIGVTGTSGKTTTCYLLSRVLEANGAKTGMLTTALFKIADKTWENRTKMTMLGRFRTQKLLRQMVDAGCTYAIVETTSQGIVQHRHEHTAYDVVVLTNLWPEHVEAHGGFENYKRAKRCLFEYTAALPKKQMNGRDIPRVEVLNGTSEHANDFVVNGFDRVVRFGAAPLQAEHVDLKPDAVTFDLNGTRVSLGIPGMVNVENALAAIAVAEAVGISTTDAARALADVHGLPGRYERIDEGQSFTVMVDYAFEPGALTKLYELVRTLPHNRILHVLGSTGGGRDVARRPVMGRMAGEQADIVFVTNEDPYDDDPDVIIRDVAQGAASAGKTDGKTLFRITDRREAIQTAIRTAQAGDLVLITGKGSEPVMAVANGKKIPWSDAAEVRKAIRGRIEADR